MKQNSMICPRIFSMMMTIILFSSPSFADLGEKLLMMTKVPLTAVASLSPTQVDLDIELFHYALETAYGGRGILPSPQYQELQAGLQRLKAQTKSMGSSELCDQLAKLTEKVSDQHLSVSLEGRVCFRSWPVANVGANSGLSAANKTWALVTKSSNNKTVQVLSIKQMTRASSEEWMGFANVVQELTRAGQPFVIDLRGNPGGDSTYGVKAARMLLGLQSDQADPSPSKTVYRRRTPEAWSVLANSFWLRIQSYENASQVPQDLVAEHRSMLGYRQKAIAGLIPSLQVEKLGQSTTNLDHAVRFPIYVLIDRHCGSACELMLEALETLPVVRTIGENTTGVVHYGNVGAIYLPESHLIVRLPTQGAIYDDRRNVEKLGYAPHTKVPSGTDALDFTLKKFF
jgi:hypothetical protein